MKVHTCESCGEEMDCTYQRKLSTRKRFCILEAFLRDANNVDFHPAIFENITGEVIRAAALHTQGAAGPSGLDALSWRRLCTAFDQKSNDLCAALATVA